MTKKNESDPLYQLKNPWEKQTHNVWLASTLSLSRNLSKFKFPNKLDKDKEQQIITLLYDSLKESPEINHPLLYHSEKMTPLQKEFLLEHFMILDNFYQAHGGEGFVFDDSGEFLAVFNLQDHIQLNMIDMQQDIEKTWNRLARIETYMGRSNDFAYHPRFGFLTSNPRQAGTGLSIALYLHIPAIIQTGELAELLEREKDEEVEAIGLQGKTTEMIGDILVAHNTCTLGLTEEYILTAMRMWATRAVVTEINIRKKIQEGDNEQIKNRVTRALGLLTHAYQLEVIEALNSLSLVKLGLELGWIRAPMGMNMNQIFFNCRRAHLMNLIEDNVEVPELPKRRAEYLKGIAQQLTLTI